ncbi:MAG: TetR/AcrR family transcriptional regulator [Variovorax sp.]|nr:MAG: TetR/AcrR family transcriptional regulator [Variovorax sp.]
MSVWPTTRYRATSVSWMIFRARRPARSSASYWPGRRRTHPPRLPTLLKQQRLPRAGRPLPHNPEDQNFDSRDSRSAHTMPMREQLRNFKKERIMQEAERLFFERGFRGTSLEAIADSMGMTKPFVYGIYDKKTDILYDISLRNISMSLEAVESARQTGGTPADRLAEVARRLTRVCIEHREAVTVFFREEASLEPEHLLVINDMKGRVDRAIGELLQEGVAAGIFQVSDVRIAALAIGGMISWTYSWYRPAGRLSAEDIQSQMALLALRVAGFKT